jgi:hypothetical protein
MGKIFQMTTKYNKWKWNIPNGYETYQMDMKHTKWIGSIPNG